MNIDQQDAGVQWLMKHRPLWTYFPIIRNIYEHGFIDGSVMMRDITYPAPLSEPIFAIGDMVRTTTRMPQVGTISSVNPSYPEPWYHVNFDEPGIGYDINESNLELYVKSEPLPPAERYPHRRCSSLNFSKHSPHTFGGTLPEDRKRIITLYCDGEPLDPHSSTIPLDERIIRFGRCSNTECVLEYNHIGDRCNTFDPDGHP